jgi:nicotinamidase-related amidase
MSSPSKKFSLGALLTPEESVLVLIDHQPFQFANLHSHEPTMIVNNVVGLAKAAKGVKVPTILTTVTEDRGGYLIKGCAGCLPRPEADQPHDAQRVGRHSGATGVAYLWEMQLLKAGERK